MPHKLSLVVPGLCGPIAQSPALATALGPLVELLSRARRDKAAGADFSNVVKATVFLKNIENFAEMNGIYAEFFPEAPPARSAVEAARLPKDVDIEIEVIAFVG